MSDECKKGANWSAEETEALIRLYGQDRYQHLLKTSTRNLFVFVKIAKDLRENHNIQRTAVQCREKIKKLRASFGRTEDKKRQGGTGRRHFCPFYDMLVPLFRERPVHNASAGTSVQASASEDEDLPENTSHDAYIIEHLVRGTTDATPGRQPVPDTSSEPSTPQTSASQPPSSPQPSAPQAKPSTQQSSQPAPPESPPRPMPRRTSDLKRKHFDTETLIKSFGDIQRAAVRSFNEAEDRRLKRLLAAERQREKREARRDDIMMKMLAQAFGVKHFN